MVAGGRPSVFLLMPFDAEFDWLHQLIAEAGESAGTSVERADNIFGAGIVIEQIKGRIATADVIVAVCTGQNPNVFYELGIADERHWPVLLAEDATDLPFDVMHYRALICGTWDHERLRRSVRNAIRDTLTGGRKDGGRGRDTEAPSVSDLAEPAVRISSLVLTPGEVARSICTR